MMKKIRALLLLDQVNAPKDELDYMSPLSVAAHMRPLQAAFCWSRSARLLSCFLFGPQSPKLKWLSVDRARLFPLWNRRLCNL